MCSLCRNRGRCLLCSFKTVVLNIEYRTRNIECRSKEQINISTFDIPCSIFDILYLAIAFFVCVVFALKYPSALFEILLTGLEGVTD